MQIRYNKMYKNVLHIQIKYKKNTGWNFLSRTIFIHARVRVKLLNSPCARLFRHYAFRSLRFTSNLSKYLNISYYYNIFVRANVTVFLPFRLINPYFIVFHEQLQVRYVQNLSKTRRDRR